MKVRSRSLRFAVTMLMAVVMAWAGYKATTVRGMSSQALDSGCESDRTTVADMEQLIPGAPPIRCQAWDVDTGVSGYVWQAPNASAAVLIEHGWGDYAQRYVKQFSQLIPHLLARGVSVYAFDMWGNGRSPGYRGATDISDAVDDHLAARRKLRAQSLPVFILGHSVGGLVTATSALREQRDLHGLILIAPALDWQVSGVMLGIARAAGFFLPTLSVPAPPPDPAAQSRDALLHRRLEQDPLMLMRSASWLTISSGAVTSNANWQHYQHITVPLLVVNGTADPVTPPSVARQFIEAVGSKDKTLGLIEGGRHSLLDDPPAETEALQFILRWLDQRLSRNSAHQAQP